MKMGMRHIALVLGIAIACWSCNKGTAGVLSVTTFPPYEEKAHEKFIIANKDDTITLTAFETHDTGNIDNFEWILEGQIPSIKTGGGPHDVSYSESSGATPYVCTVELTHYGDGPLALMCSKPQIPVKIYIPTVSYKTELDEPKVTNYIPSGVKLKGDKPDLRTDITIVTKPNYNLGTITVYRGGSPATGPDDALKPSKGSTSGSGSFATTFKTRDKSPDISLRFKSFKSEDHNMLPAKYRKKFECTIYYTTQESAYVAPDYNPASKTTISVGGTNYTYQSRFVSRAKVEGGGELVTAVGGKGYLQYDTSSGWFFTNSPLGTASRVLAAKHSCAVDKNYIKIGSTIKTVNTDIANAFGNNTWTADDVGQAIVGGGHIDLYWGVAAPRSSARTDLPAGTTIDTVNNVDVLLVDYD